MPVMIPSPQLYQRDPGPSLYFHCPRIAVHDFGPARANASDQLQPTKGRGVSIVTYGASQRHG